MDLFNRTTNIRFMEARIWVVPISLLIVVASIWWWVKLGSAKYGVDFLGGTELVVKFESPVEVSAVREALDKAGVNDATVQAFEQSANEYSIRAPQVGDANSGAKLSELLSGQSDWKFTVLKEDFVGPVIGEQIRQDGLKALILSFIGILIYVSSRFEWRYAMGAVVSLLHDAIVSAGVFVMSGKTVNVAVLAAVLTIIGYSVNDTIVIYDRIRENILLSKKKKASYGDGLSPASFLEVANLSINQTLSRTILTNTATMLSVLALWIFGTGSIVDLAFTLTIGMVAGTYSTIYIACPTILLLKRLFPQQPARTAA